jgi:hypothetical protein
LGSKSLQFDFFYAVHLIRKEFYNDIREEIICRTFEYVENIVFDENKSTVLVPCGLPLIIEYLCYSNIDKSQMFQAKFSFCLKANINFYYCVKFGLTSILLHHFQTENLSEIWHNSSKLLSQAMSNHTSLYDFSIFMKILKTSNFSTKMALLNIFYNSLTDENIGSSNYFYFSHGFYLKLETLSDSYFLDSEYSLAL